MSFDLLAPHYRWIEALAAGGKLQRCRTAMLPKLPAPDNVLIFGEGNGRFLVELLSRFPAAQITVVELSAEMIRLARERLRRAGLDIGRVHFIQADALAWQPPAKAFDLIVTCFFLDCFREDQLATLIPAIADAAKLDARWLIADFQIAPTGWRRWRSQFIVWLLYRFFRCVTRLPGRHLLDPSMLLVAAGFVRIDHDEQDHGLLYADLWQSINMPSVSDKPADEMLATNAA